MMYDNSEYPRALDNTDASSNQPRYASVESSV